MPSFGRGPGGLSGRGFLGTGLVTRRGGSGGDEGRGPLWPPALGVSPTVQEQAPHGGRPQGPPPRIRILPRPYGHIEKAEVT